MGILAEWNIYTTWIAGALITFASFSILLRKEPDVHPYLLARQATRGPVRQPGESAAYRSLETPHGFPLRSGLNVRDAGAPKWTGGRRGDLRDIWRTATRGAINEDGSISGKQGKIFTVLGNKVIEHSLDSITQDINVVGRYLSDAKSKTVAICLTDSAELLTVIFAGAFYNFKIVLIPHHVTSQALLAHLQKVGADALIAEAGSHDLAIIARDCAQLSHVVLVASPGSMHMDWSGVPGAIQDNLKVAVWHEMIVERRNLTESEVPEYDPSSPTPSVSTLRSLASDDEEFVEYLPENLVAGIGALGAVLPRSQRFSHDDLVLSIDSLSRSYPFCLVMAALFVNASVALHSVAGERVNFALATAGVSPTVIVTSSRTMSDYHKIISQRTHFVSRVSRWFQTHALDAGRMPSRSLLSQLAYVGPTVELSLDKLRLLCISHPVDASSEARLTYQQLSDLRVFIGARIVYALTGPGVAGAISQTSIWDYRRGQGPSHFGAPVSSVEITLAGVPENVADPDMEGQITVKGPAVTSQTTTLLSRGRFQNDNTLDLC